MDKGFQAILSVFWFLMFFVKGFQRFLRIFFGFLRGLLAFEGSFQNPIGLWSFKDFKEFGGVFRSF